MALDQLKFAWYLTDKLGTVRDLVDVSGDLLNHIDYDSFGQIIAQSNALAGDRFTFTGREWDGEVDLYYYRARFYDASLGRFVSQDPLRFEAGDSNLYRYVGNGVLEATDPSGTSALAEAAKTFGVAGAIVGAIGGLLCGVADGITMQKSAGQFAADTVSMTIQGGLLGFLVGTGVGLLGPSGYVTGFALGFGGITTYAYIMEDIGVPENVSADDRFWIRVGRASCVGLTVGASIGLPYLPNALPRGFGSRFGSGPVGKFLRSVWGETGGSWDPLNPLGRPQPKPWVPSRPQPLRPRGGSSAPEGDVGDLIAYLRRLEGSATGAQLEQIWNAGMRLIAERAATFAGNKPVENNFLGNYGEWRFYFGREPAAGYDTYAIGFNTRTGTFIIGSKNSIGYRQGPNGEWGLFIRRWPDPGEGRK